MYAHSNEIEEIGIISLTGVNVESNPEMEALLGVRSVSSFYLIYGGLIEQRPAEKVYVHALYVVELLCARRHEPQGATSMDCEARPDPTPLMTFMNILWLMANCHQL